MIDSHCHLQATALRPQVGSLVDEARRAGVQEILVAGILPAEAASTVQMAVDHGLWCSVGCHPCHPEDWNPAALQPWLTHPRVVAVGECGLDYYHKPFDALLQQSVFRAQIQLAQSAGLPLILHNRESDQDLIAILRDQAPVGGVFHCFGADRATLEAALELGFYISFAGNVTYPKATFRELVASVPSHRLLIETDAPWLAPIPYRGKTNRPALVAQVRDEVAGLRGDDPKSLGLTLLDNFYRCFPKTRLAEPST